MRERTYSVHGGAPTFNPEEFQIQLGGGITGSKNNNETGIGNENNNGNGNGMESNVNNSSTDNVATTGNGNNNGNGNENNNAKNETGNENNNGTKNENNNANNETGNSNVNNSSTDNVAPSDSANDLYDKIINLVNIDDVYALFDGSITYDQYEPLSVIKMVGVNPQVPIYNRSMCYNIYRVTVKSLPTHQKEYLKSLCIKAENENGLDTIPYIWALNYHPNLKGVHVCSYHPEKKPKDVDATKLNDLKLFGCSTLYKTSGESTVLNKVVNSRVKLINVNDLPAYQKKWLNFLYTTFDQNKDNILSRFGGITNDSSDNMLLNYNLYNEKSNIDSFLSKVNEVNEDVSMFNGAKLFFLDWNLEQTRPLILHPSQIFYHFSLPYFTQEHFYSIMINKHTQDNENNNAKILDSLTDKNN